MPDATESPLRLKSAEAILAVGDVVAAAKFYREVLGFEREWLWGDPPSFGGVRWGAVQVMFCLQPDLALRVDGHQLAFFCDDINALRERHRSRGAPVISEIENKPWGMREYIVRDPNGYHLRFGGPEQYERPAAALASVPGFVRLVERIATIEEFVALAAALGWRAETETYARALRNSIYGVVALDTRESGAGRVIGSIRIVGDGARFYYIQDVMVAPELQGQRIGSAMMERVMGWLRRTAPKGAYVGLFTGKPGFYERYGFTAGGGMSMTL